MVTIRQIEKLWNAKNYRRLLRTLTEARPEASARLEKLLAGAIPAAAMTLIRLDELDQPGAPLAGEMIRTLLLTQEADGGWGDPMTTALCLRALRCGDGGGAAVDAALDYLANLQKSEGIWPAEPLRRLPADAYVSAFVLFHLARDPRFREAVRFEDAVNWFSAHHAELDPEARRLWDRAAPRCRQNRVYRDDAVTAGGSGSASTMSSFRRDGSGPIVSRLSS